MGRIYRSIEISNNGAKTVTVAIVDTGADETVISEKIAKRIDAQLYGTFRAICASDTVIEGRYTDVIIRDLLTEKESNMIVGVSGVPFSTDDIDDEGVDVILGVDYLQ